MAGEEKKDDRVPMTAVNSPQTWVEAYYGDDAQDLKKVNKLKHIKHTAQFASFCYVISKNTKTAHTDFFKDNYTTVDKMYARAAELILNLLYIRFKEGRELTADDFDSCGGASLFEKGTNPNYAEICNDYLKEGGMVDMCQTLLPISQDNEKTAGVVKEITDDFDNVKKDHTFLLSVCDPKGENGTLTREQIFSLFHSSSECAAKAWRRYKKAKPTAEGDLQKDVEDAFYLRYDLAKKSGKVAMLGGTAVASLGAVVSGVFWPAVILIPIYSLSKQWVPDWFKSAGAMWGNFEKRFKDKRNIDRAGAMQKWVVSYAENGGKPKLTLKERFLISKADEAFLKKQAKQINEGVSVEGTDGKLRKSQMEIAMDALSGSKSFGTLLNATATDNLVPADIYPILSARVSALNPSNVQFKDFIEIAETFNSIESKLSTDAKTAIIYGYAEKLGESAKKLIFGTPFQSTDYYTVIQAQLKPESVIMKMLEKANRHDIVGTINKLLTLGSKELTGFGKEQVGMNLEQFIMRTVPERIGADSPELSKLAIDPTTATGKYKVALDLILGLQLDSSDPRKFVTASGKELLDVTKLIGEITDSDQKEKCNKLLKKQMDTLVLSKDRSDSRLVFSLATAKDGYGVSGKVPLASIFEKFKDITYDNAHSFSEDINISKIRPQQAQDYVKGKLGKQIHDIMYNYCNNNKVVFESDLDALAKFLKKVNENQYLNEKQKMDLTAMASASIKPSLDNKFKELSTYFMSKYNYSDVSKYLSSYAHGGFQELFETDQSKETQDLKKRIVHLVGMSDDFDTLKLGGYALHPTDAMYIADSLFKDKLTGEIIIREPTDELRLFISRMNKASSFGETLIIPTGATRSVSDPTVPSGKKEVKDTPKLKIPTLTPYKILDEELASLKKMRAEIEEDVKLGNCSSENAKRRLHDNYTALIILRSKGIAVFRQFMKTLVNEGAAGAQTTIASWAGGVGRDIIDQNKNVWGVLLGCIDDEIDGFKKEHSLASTTETPIKIELGASNIRAKDQLEFYTSASDIEKIVGKTDILVEMSK